jgi:glutamate--cysteine ligase
MKNNYNTCETPLTRDCLKAYFVDGCKSSSDLQLGMEWEKIGIYADTGQAIRYSGNRGVEAIFKALSSRYGWQPVISDGSMIALEKGKTSITLEPGGQIELSGHKAATLDENAAELRSHLDEIREVSAPLGIVWLGIGAQPCSVQEDIEWVPKSRYAVMRSSLAGKGAMTYKMMKETASVQISLDYTNEEDASEKLRLAMGLAPIFSAMFANSPFERGKLSGYYSRRARIWLETAPERSGVVRKIFESSFSFDDYIDYALSVPVLFLVRDDRWLAVHDRTFGDYLEKGYEGLTATWADWELHLTGIFTEARLKTYVEIRSLDCQRSEMGLGAAALMKGLFYDGVSRQEAWRLVEDLSWEDRMELASKVPQTGLKTPFQGADLLDVARQLVILGEEGLSRLKLKEIISEKETGYLKPVRHLIVDRGISPAEALMQQIDAANFLKTLIQSAEL